MAVQVLPAGDAGRHVAGALRRVVLALVTRHPDDFAGLDDLLVTIAV